MITKRKGNGQTECRGCKEKGKFALNWDSWLYTFNGKPYCFNCLMEMLELYQQRMDKATNYYLHKLAENKSMPDEAVKMFNYLEGNIR